MYEFASVAMKLACLVLHVRPAEHRTILCCPFACQDIVVPINISAW
jgi:hypothetical protein